MFVARALWDQFCKTQTALEERCSHLQDLNRTLVQQIVEMKRDGFSKAPEHSVLPAKAHDPVQDAIALAAKNDSALRRHLGAFAKARRAEGTSDDEIVSKILHWEEDAEGV